MLEDQAQDAVGGYHAFLVRLWQSEPEAPWRASARDVRTGSEQHFASVERLFVFLSHQTRRDGGPADR
jgi:hypothetical protein